MRQCPSKFEIEIRNQPKKPNEYERFKTKHRE